MLLLLHTTCKGGRQERNEATQLHSKYESWINPRFNDFTRASLFHLFLPFCIYPVLSGCRPLVAVHLTCTHERSVRSPVNYRRFFAGEKQTRVMMAKFFSTGKRLNSLLLGCNSAARYSHPRVVCRREEVLQPRWTETWTVWERGMCQERRVN
jgi:hypothetical protein